VALGSQEEERGNAVSKFSLHHNQYGDIDGCTLCGCEVPTIKTDHPNIIQHRGEQSRLCEICYTTQIGNVLAWPDNHRGTESVQIARCMAHLGNLILGKMRRKDGEK
jgi:hypothetical protein